VSTSILYVFLVGIRVIPQPQSLISARLLSRRSRRIGSRKSVIKMNGFSDRLESHLTSLIYSKAEAALSGAGLTIPDLTTCRSGLLADCSHTRKGHTVNQDIRWTQWRSRRVLH